MSSSEVTPLGNFIRNLKARKQLLPPCLQLVSDNARSHGRTAPTSFQQVQADRWNDSFSSGIGLSSSWSTEDFEQEPRRNILRAISQAQAIIDFPPKSPIRLCKKCPPIPQKSPTRLCKKTLLSRSRTASP